MIHVLYRGSSSACFELESSRPYYAPEEYTVCVDGVQVLRGDANVFSLFSLTPEREYEIAVRLASGGEERVQVRTRSERCCVSVRDFGAAGDGIHEDTVAIQAAINFLPEGGRLFFPPGTYLTLPLALKSHITLELSEGATLLGSTERERYPIIRGVCVDPVTGRELPQAGFEGIEGDMYQSLLHASYAEDVTVVGRGVIDGNGQNGDWWGDFKSFPAARPRVVFLNRSKHITLHGVTVANGPSWHLHPFFSEDVSLYDCAVTAPKDSPNTDAIDPESCDGVNIIGCRFSVGDDCIAIKSGKIDMGRKYKRPADHHVIRNCLMQFGHGAVTLGSELAAGIQNLSVSQCYFRATDRGLRIKSRRGRGKYAVIDGVEFSNIRMVNVMAPLVINMYYNCDPDGMSEYVWSKDPYPVDDTTPYLGAFTFRDMECTDCEWAAGYFYGLTEQPIGSITIENVRFTFKKDASTGQPAMMSYVEPTSRMGLYFNCVKKVTLKNVTMEGQAGPKVLLEHVEEQVDQ